MSCLLNDNLNENQLEEDRPLENRSPDLSVCSSVSNPATKDDIENHSVHEENDADQLPIELSKREESESEVLELSSSQTKINSNSLLSSETSFNPSLNANTEANDALVDRQYSSPTSSVKDNYAEEVNSTVENKLTSCQGIEMEERHRENEDRNLEQDTHQKHNLPVTNVEESNEDSSPSGSNQPAKKLNDFNQKNAQNERKQTNEANQAMTNQEKEPKDESNQKD